MTTPNVVARTIVATNDAMLPSYSRLLLGNDDEAVALVDAYLPRSNT